MALSVQQTCYLGKGRSFCCLCCLCRTASGTTPRVAQPRRRVSVPCTRHSFRPEASRLNVISCKSRTQILFWSLLPLRLAAEPLRVSPPPPLGYAEEGVPKPTTDKDSVAGGWSSVVQPSGVPGGEPGRRQASRGGGLPRHDAWTFLVASWYDIHTGAS